MNNITFVTPIEFTVCLLLPMTTRSSECQEGRHSFSVTIMNTAVVMFYKSHTKFTYVGYLLLLQLKSLVLRSITHNIMLPMTTRSSVCLEVRHGFSVTIINTTMFMFYISHTKFTNVGYLLLLQSKV